MSEFDSPKTFIKALRDYEKFRHEFIMKWLDEAEKWLKNSKEKANLNE